MSKIKIVCVTNTKYTLDTICPFCGQKHTITVPRFEFADGMRKYMQGLSLQYAFPTFTPSQREFIHTGICDNCWEKM